MPSQPAPTSYPVGLELPVLWGDQDALGHVNNVVYFRWFEAARIRYMEALGRAVGRGPRGPILASTACSFAAPVHYPDTIAVEIGAVRVGTKSFAFALRVTSRASGAVVATGEAVMVWFDYARGESIPVDAELRAAIEALEGRASV